MKSHRKLYTVNEKKKAFDCSSGNCAATRRFDLFVDIVLKLVS